MNGARWRKSRARVSVGQSDIFGVVHGLDKLVRPPEIVEADGLRVIRFVVPQDDRAVPGYVDEVKEQARRLQPEAKSKSKPPWMNPAWQAKRRKRAARNGT